MQPQFLDQLNKKIRNYKTLLNREIASKCKNSLPSLSNLKNISLNLDKEFQIKDFTNLLNKKLEIIDSNDLQITQFLQIMEKFLDIMNQKMQILQTKMEEYQIKRQKSIDLNKYLIKRGLIREEQLVDVYNYLIREINMPKKIEIVEDIKQQIKELNGQIENQP